MTYENESIGCDPNTPRRVEGPPINTPHEIALLQQHEYLPRVPSGPVREEVELVDRIDLDDESDDSESGDSASTSTAGVFGAAVLTTTPEQ